MSPPACLSLDRCAPVMVCDSAGHSWWDIPDIGLLPCAMIDMCANCVPVLTCLCMGMYAVCVSVSTHQHSHSTWYLCTNELPFHHEACMSSWWQFFITFFNLTAYMDVGNPTQITPLIVLRKPPWKRTWTTKMQWLRSSEMNIREHRS